MPCLSHAQRATTSVARVGFLTPQGHQAREQAFRQELRRLGYVDGQNMVLHYRSADGRFERLPDLAGELVGLNVDVLVTVVTQATVAAKKGTDSIPIVMVAKQLELLREILPRASQVSALWNPANGLRMVEARTADELGRAFGTIVRQRPQALLVMADPMLSSQAPRIAEVAIKHRLPSVSSGRDSADGGLLVSYGPNFVDAYVRAAAYVDRILRGAKPADLPVEQGTKFDLVVNARTARLLGVTLPPSVILRADQVLE